MRNKLLLPLQVIITLLLTQPMIFATGRPQIKKRASFSYDKIDENAFLNAVSQIESGGKRRAIGAQGERTEYQMTEAVWRKHTTAGWTLAGTSAPYDRYVAKCHLEWLISVITQSTERPRVEVLFAAWKYGQSHAHRNQYTDYATRAANLYYDAR